MCRKTESASWVFGTVVVIVPPQVCLFCSLWSSELCWCVVSCTCGTWTCVACWVTVVSRWCAGRSWTRLNSVVSPGPRCATRSDPQKWRRIRFNLIHKSRTDSDFREHKQIKMKNTKETNEETHGPVCTDVLSLSLSSLFEGFKSDCGTFVSFRSFVVSFGCLCWFITVLGLF